MTDGIPQLFDPLDFESAFAERYRKRVEAKTGRSIFEVVALALEAEANGASPREVRRILDGEKPQERR